MANEIVILSLDRHPDGDAHVRAAFLYPINPVIDTVGGVTIVPTPVNNLPPEIAALQLFTQGELNALDNGNATYLIVDRFITADELTDLPSLVRKIRNLYASLNPVPDLRTKYSRTGQRIDA